MDKHNLYSVMCDTKTELWMIHYFFHLVKCSKEIITSIFTLLHFNRYFHIFIILCFKTWQPLLSLHVTVYRSIRHACTRTFRCTHSQTHKLSNTHFKQQNILTWKMDAHDVPLILIKVSKHRPIFARIITCYLWDIHHSVEGRKVRQGSKPGSPHPLTLSSSGSYASLWVISERITLTQNYNTQTAKDMFRVMCRILFAVKAMYMRNHA